MLIILILEPGGKFKLLVKEWKICLKVFKWFLYLSESILYYIKEKWHFDLQINHMMMMIKSHKKVVLEILFKEIFRKIRKTLKNSFLDDKKMRRFLSEISIFFFY